MWTGLFFWTIFFGLFFGTILKGEHTINTEGGVGWSLSVLREEWEVECYCSGRGVRQTITTEGGVGGGWNRKHCWLMELLLDRTNNLNWFFDWVLVSKNLSAGPRRIFIVMSCESETATLTLDFNLYWKYRVYDPPLLSYACAFWVNLCTISCFKFPFVYTVCNY